MAKQYSDGEYDYTVPADDAEFTYGAPGSKSPQLAAKPMSLAQRMQRAMIDFEPNVRVTPGSAVEATGRGINNFLGIGDEVSGGVEFLKHLPQGLNKATQAYDDGEKSYRARDAQVAKENPALYNTGTVAPALVGAPQTLLGRLGMAAGIGAAHGDGLQDRAVKAGETTALGGAFEALPAAAEAAEPLASKLGNFVRRIGGKIRTGSLSPTATQLKDIQKSTGLDAADLGVANMELGNSGPFAGPKGVEKKALGNMDKFGAETDALSSRADAELPWLPTNRITDNLRSSVNSDFWSPSESRIANAGRKEVSKLDTFLHNDPELRPGVEHEGPSSSYSLVNALKRKYQEANVPGTPMDVSKPLGKSIGSGLRREVETGMSADPELGSAMKQANRNFAVSTETHDMAAAAAAKREAEPLTKQVFHAATDAMSPAAAHLLNFAGKQVMSVPKYAQQLTEAAKQGGLQFALTHALLLRDDPEYAAMYRSEKP